MITACHRCMHGFPDGEHENPKLRLPQRETGGPINQAPPPRTDLARAGGTFHNKPLVVATPVAYTFPWQSDLVFGGSPPGAPVAQLDRASVYGTEGFGFESRQARFTKPCYIKTCDPFCSFRQNSRRLGLGLASIWTRHRETGRHSHAQESACLVPGEPRSLVRRMLGGWHTALQGPPQ